ncbi:MAG: hypothetical protein PF485_13220 [Bacteroidales bacterium]|jgi:hypothetical protein|nr:hypothetical protein [Bacteroidales bacterium]
MEHAIKTILIYFKFLLKELISPLNYFMAFLIGVVINYFQGIGIFSSLVPFIVPIIVQSISKASVKFGNRNLDLLVRLPMEKKDPAFVINTSGEVVASEGKTKDFFVKNKVTNFQDIFENQQVKVIKNLITESCSTSVHTTEEWYSPRIEKWYSINMKSDEFSNNVLVWLDDISLRKKLDERLSKIRNFSTQMMLSIDEQLKSTDSYDRLAQFVLDQGYKGIFITNKEKNGNLKGFVYSLINGQISKSGDIVIPKDSEAPIWKSRHSLGIVTDSINNYTDLDVFYQNNRFDTRVLKFLDFKIENFINYHEEDISVITFNKQSEITQHDLILMEGIVNSAFTINYLVNIINNCK